MGNDEAARAFRIINEHFEKHAAVGPDGNVRVTGFSEINRKLNAGKPCFGDILKFALTNDHLPDAPEIARMSKQGEQETELQPQQKQQRSRGRGM